MPPRWISGPPVPTQWLQRLLQYLRGSCHSPAQNPPGDSHITRVNLRVLTVACEALLAPQTSPLLLPPWPPHQSLGPAADRPCPFMQPLHAHPAPLTSLSWFPPISRHASSPYPALFFLQSTCPYPKALIYVGWLHFTICCS